MKKLSLALLLLALVFSANPLFAQGTDNAFPQLLTSYYDVKNALVSSDANSAASKANVLLSAVKAVDVKKLSEKDKKAFGLLKDKLVLDAEHIAESKDVDHQRDHFSTLSTNVYALAKAVKLTDKPVYYDYCPMKKMYWLSDEQPIKNPYYGKSMLTCGKITETIK